MSNLDAIAKRSDLYASSRQLLSERVAALNEGIAALRRDHIPGIKRALAKAAQAEAELRELVEANPDCFTKPKTRVLNGVKVGFQKGKGVISFADPAAVVARIKRHLPDQVEILVNVKESPVKDALAQLDGADLKKLGVTISAAGDQVVVKPVDSEVDKMVDALLKDATETEREDA
ncbi:hypothetical protein G8A07_15630 [Roseateles sp. DAIF2]|uniref:host-nuclease inhibitor Gam family protein n=1 Tax=Roseateles sp. DAIF2 TaxID=2714952 RepID=UPI0018A2659E|nr:host-nuclease inhibitor Gam family protein [Roseateles sp. DAIF2]QPF74206.1 hypothetical protein G8A07_15630 [Roseateles sp. DAIF2]